MLFLVLPFTLAFSLKDIPIQQLQGGKVREVVEASPALVLDSLDVLVEINQVFLSH